MAPWLFLPSEQRLNGGTTGQFLREILLLVHMPSSHSWSVAKVDFPKFSLSMGHTLRTQITMEYYISSHWVRMASNQDNVLLAIALVPIENIANMSWFIAMCYVAGLPINKWPIFCDRGHLLSAATYLKETHDFDLNLKYCLQHIIWNIIAKFKITQSLDERLLHCGMAQM